MRARSHLNHIIPSLREQQIPYHGVAIDPLASRVIVQDLLNLSKALLHFADRLAWLCVLRAPWCGLTLVDLTKLSEDPSKTIWQNLNDPLILSSLSVDGQQRVTWFNSILRQTIENKQRLSLRDWIEETWYALNGPELANDPSQLQHASSYFELLEQVEFAGDILDFSWLEEKLETLFADTQPSSSNPVQIMTIHKSKGLEFDLVIIPSLERQSTQDPAPLLAWLEQPQDHHHSELLLAPININPQQPDPTYSYIRRQQQIKAQLEQARLLYVAVTRAKQQLYLLGTLSTDEEGKIKTPATSSFLKLLWPMLTDVHHPENIAARLEAKEEQATTYPFLKRRITVPAPQPFIKVIQSGSTPTWQAQEIASQGTFLHRLLQRFVEYGPDFWLKKSSLQQQQAISQELPHLSAKEADLLLEKIHALLTCPTAQWIINATENSAVELPLSIKVGKEIKH